MLVAVVLVDAVWLLITPLSLRYDSYSEIAANGAAAALILVLRRRSTSPLTYTLLSAAGFALVAWPALRLFNHLTMSAALPLADARLAMWDAQLGFDWLAYVRWVDRYPLLIHAMNMTYGGLTLYSCGIFIALLLWSGVDRAREFVLLFLLCAVTMSTIGMFFPAVAAMVHYAPDPAGFRHVEPGWGTYHLRYLSELRTDPNHVLAVRDLPGLVTFPSFHTAMGVIAIICARDSRVTVMMSITAINLVMIASTPVFGSHYIVDVVAGAAIAGLLAVALRVIEGRRSERVSMQACELS
jgi:hypothetical protein